VAIRFYGGLVAVGVWNETRPADDAPVGDTGTDAQSTSADPV